MGGGLLQLVAYGAQDVYLTGNPQITFFKVVYRRHTNFSMESIQQTFNGSATLGSRVTAQISRNGDLLHKLYLKVGFTTDSITAGKPVTGKFEAKDVGGTASASPTVIGETSLKTVANKGSVKVEFTSIESNIVNFTSYTGNGGFAVGDTFDIDDSAGTTEAVGKVTITAIDTPETYLQPFYGYRMLKTVELEIGGQRIDRQYGEWMYIWNELTIPTGKKDGLYTMVGGQKDNVPIKYNGGTNVELYIPLEFWFCRNIGLALPLIALQYHEVKLNIEFNNMADILAKNSGDNVAVSSVANKDASKFVVTTPTDIKTAFKEGSLSMELWADYVFLDTDERRRFAQMSHEYLIEQVQFTGTESVSAGAKSYRLSFNHPVKELVWAIRPTITGHEVNWNNFGYSDGTNVVNTVADKNRNTSDRVNCVNSSKLMLNGNDRFAMRGGDYFSMIQPYQHHTNIPTSNKGINVYSFALKPEEHQPSGTLNMSRIDQASLQVDSKTEGTMFVYAHNYNVLRILSGMGGLAYSN